MKEYKLSDKNRPITEAQLISYCSKFYKRSKAIELIKETVFKFPSEREEAMFCKKVTVFYSNNFLTLMSSLSPDFEGKRKIYDKEKEEQKKFEAGAATRKLKALGI